MKPDIVKDVTNVVDGASKVVQSASPAITRPVVGGILGNVSAQILRHVSGGWGSRKGVAAAGTALGTIGGILFNAAKNVNPPAPTPVR